MEKKTIGKFISALRKANGMTQKELGEKLFVSDKTVSRWECDECTPELFLIPSIAENSCFTLPSRNLMPSTAAPGNADKRILLRQFPIVRPKPFSKGSQTTFA